MMACQMCAAETRVQQTRTTSRGVYRRRACPACGWRVTTYEITSEQHERLSRRTKDAHKRIKRVLSGVEQHLRTLSGV